MKTNATSEFAVLMITPRFFPYIGGVETHVYEVARRLAARGVDITILSTDTTGNLPKQEYRNGLKLLRVRAYPQSGDLYFAPEIRHIINDGKWDLIHCQSLHTLVAPVAMLSALEAAIPYLITTHMSIHASRLRNAIRPLQWRLLRPLLMRARGVIAVSSWETNYLRRLLAPCQDRIHHIPNGTDFLVAKHQTLDSSNPLIVSVGRLDPLKGHQRVIRAFRVLANERPNTRLQIVGTGPYESDLRQLVQQLDLMDKVTIRGIPGEQRDQMGNLLYSANLVVLLSNGENNPIAVLEALALRRPLLLSYTHGLQSFVDNKQAVGIPVESSPEETARAMARQLDEPLIPPTVELPTWDEGVRKILNLYATSCSRYRQILMTIGALPDGAGDTYPIIAE